MKIDGQKLTALSVLSLAFLLLIAGVCMTVAGLARYQAAAFIEVWEQRGKEPQAQAWDIAYAAAQRAVAYYPVANGDYLDRLGRIHAWRYFLHPVADLQAQHSSQAALLAYQASVAARPTWPYTWARLAHTKLLLQQFDSEFDEALSRAFELGPWRIGINRELAYIGVRAWPAMDKTQRLRTLQNVRRVVGHSPGEARQLQAIAKQAGLETVLCQAMSVPQRDVDNICR